MTAPTTAATAARVAVVGHAVHERLVGGGEQALPRGAADVRRDLVRGPTESVAAAAATPGRPATSSFMALP